MDSVGDAYGSGPPRREGSVMDRRGGRMKSGETDRATVKEVDDVRRYGAWLDLTASVVDQGS